MDNVEEAPKDFLKLAYVSFFLLGAGFLLPWNAFITAVDYFNFLYPGAQIDRVFSVAYMLPAMLLLLYLTFKAAKIKPQIRINLGLVLFLVMMLMIPIMDECFKTSSPVTHGITIAAVCITGMADALVQGSLVGSAGQLPECYMQAMVAGTAASGVLVSFLRILTKAALPATPDGLRQSANVYFIVSVIFMVVCIVAYNIVTSLPVIRYHLKQNADSTLPLLQQTVDEDKQVDKSFTDYTQVWSKCRGLLLSLTSIYVITISIFPGSLTEDVHSDSLGDWFPVLIIACYNVADLIGKCLTAVFLMENTRLIISGSLARFLFFPVFALCLHGPAFLSTELPVFVITTLLGITNGYFTSVIMIKAPKLVPVEDAETTGIITVVFLTIGLALGSLGSWLWVI